MKLPEAARLTADKAPGGVSGEEFAWQALPGSQRLFLSCPIYECLLSGSRGGGKTDVLLMDFLQHVGQGFGSEWRGVLFRTQFRDLGDVINKSLKWFPRIRPGAKFNWAKSEWKFPDGETLLFRHIKRPSDYQAYHGHAYPWIGFEELTNWADDVVYKLMMSCCRSTVQGMPRKLRATTNPYGVGFNWVKSRFELPMKSFKVIREEGSPPRTSIMSYLQENIHLLAAEPDYIDRIREAARNSSEEKAWIFGAWDITSGGMFDDLWDEQTHVIQRFKIPKSWSIFRSFDWGSSKPFSVGWWAVSDGTDAGGRSWVRGDMIRIGEWYGWHKKQPNVGLRMLAGDIAKGIVEREEAMKIADRVEPGPADSSIFDQENGNCIATDMQEEDVIWLPADKRPGSRKHGWEQCRKMLKAAIRKANGEPREDPGLFTFDVCDQFQRTFPNLPRDEVDLDDVDTNAEDHIADETRYAVRGAVSGDAGVW